DPSLGRVEGRRVLHDRIDEQLSEWTGARAAPEVVRALRERRIPGAEVLLPSKMYGEPHLEARGYYQALDHPASGTRRYPVWPLRCSFGPVPHYRSPAPTLGQHNDEILSGELGLSPTEIQRLRDLGVIGERLKR